MHRSLLLLTLTLRQSCRVLTKNMSAEVEITLRGSTYSGPASRALPIPIEAFSANKEMGRILVRRGGETIGAGKSHSHQFPAMHLTKAGRCRDGAARVKFGVEESRRMWKDERNRTQVCFLEISTCIDTTNVAQVMWKKVIVISAEPSTLRCGPLMSCTSTQQLSFASLLPIRTRAAFGVLGATVMSASATRSEGASATSA